MMALACPASVCSCLGETEQVSRWTLSCGHMLSLSLAT